MGQQRLAIRENLDVIQTLETNGSIIIRRTDDTQETVKRLVVKPHRRVGCRVAAIQTVFRRTQIVSFL
ncbi:hypothetical protein EGT31_04280 [Bordetella bronchiseptica]|nr:hypothetical protein EGT31_04280 [Bordetella bronchiseptica]